MQKKFYNLSFFVFLKNMFQKVKYNLKDAQDLGITNDDKVVIYNKYGRIKVKVYISDSVPKGVLWSPRQFIGLNGEPQNSLTPTITQKIGGGPIFNSIVVKIFLDS